MAGDRKRSGRADRKEMPFLEHLEELRGLLLQSALAIVLLACGAWFFSERALDYLVEPVGTLVFLGPADAFTLRLKVALLLGFLASLPFVLYKVWGFVAPGLFEGEKRAIALTVAGSTVLFLGGAAFGFLVFVPIAVRFLLGFATETLRPMISATSYFSFVAKMLLAFGIVFQLPLVVVILTYFGLLQPEWLLRQWRYAIVLIACVAAVLTPPDVASQVLMGLPVVALYFLSVALSFAIRRARRREKERSDDEEAADADDEGEDDGEAEDEGEGGVDGDEERGDGEPAPGGQAE